MNNTATTILTSILPVIIIATCLWYVISKSQKLPMADYEKLRNRPKTPFARGNFLLGLLWVGIGVFELVTIAYSPSGHHGTTFQYVYGGFALVYGGFIVGGSLPKAYDAGTPAAKRTKK